MAAVNEGGKAAAANATQVGLAAARLFPARMRVASLVEPLAVVVGLVCVATLTVAAERLPLNEGWEFRHGDTTAERVLDPNADGWQSVSVPHDWSVALPADPKAPSLGGGGFAPTGVGWYRRKISTPNGSTPETDANERVCTLEFEGVFERAEVYLDGVLLGRNHYGYTPFRFDVTHVLSEGQEHTLAVRVDNSNQPNSRWYTGSGIYRPVWLDVRPRVHVSDAYAETVGLDEEGAEVVVRGALRNASAADADLDALVRVVDAEGVTAAEQRVTLPTVPGGQQQEFRSRLRIANPRPWSAHRPYLYRLVVELQPAEGRGEPLDRWEASCGLRTIVVDPARGLLVNGSPVKLFGGNVHHDHGPLGAAAHAAAEWRRVRLLKEAGFNAVRTAHNPPSVAFLDACDTLGLWVVDEAFDNWRVPKVRHDYGPAFDRYAVADLATLVRRDRGRPSVLMWSIGNEVEERGDPAGLTIADRLIEAVRRLDKSRPITAGVNKTFDGREWSVVEPLIDRLDVAGYNYETQRIAAAPEQAPDRVIVSSESYPADAFQSWKATHSGPHAVGDFVWSAIDYLGEAGIGRAFPPGEVARGHWDGSHFPHRVATCGDIDLIGRRRPVSHFRQVVWNRGARLHAAVVEPNDGGEWSLTRWAVEPTATHWTWGVPPGTPLRLLIASRWPTVAITLNGRELERRTVSEQTRFRAELVVPYEPGELTVAGIDAAGAVRETRVLETASPAARVELTVEPSACAHDATLRFIRVRLVDDAGRTQPWDDQPVRFSLTGGATLVAAGNADPTHTDAYTRAQCPTYRGHALVVARLLAVADRCEVIAERAGVAPARVVIDPAAPRVASSRGGE